jgi:hypothetical protein
MTTDSPLSVPVRDFLSVTALQWGIAPLSPLHFALPREKGPARDIGCASSSAADSAAAAAELEAV